MSSLLRPIVLDPCQTTIRGRRRSSIHPLNSIPRLLSVTSTGTDECAISDDSNVLDTPDTAVSETKSSHFYSPPSLSPLSDAHISDYFTSTAAPRHKNSAPPLYNFDSPSPTSTLAPSGLPRLKTSSTNAKDESSYFPSHESMKWRLASGYFAYFLCGWGDGVTGTVLPYFTAEFHLTAMTSSLLFAGGTCGFALGTVLVESSLKALGRIQLGTGRNTIVPPRVVRLFTARNGTGGYSASQARSLALAIASVLHGFYFIMIGLKGGFGTTFLAYAVAAFARAILTACLNDFFASGPGGALGYSYAFWSFGGVMSPIICQSIVSSGVPWFHFYFGSLVLSGLNATFLIFSFKPTRREFQKERESLTGMRSPSETVSSSNLPSPTSEQGGLPLSNTQPVVPPPTNMFRIALTMPYQWAFSIFAMLYCGSETATQGFMVTYLLATRNANPKTVGYVTSGFWGGITIGRLTWGYLSPRLNFTQKKFTILGSIRVVLALVMQLLIWFVDSNVQNSVSASIFGALYGPIFPACLSMANDLLPSKVHMVSMTLISTFASIGSSLFPFVAGVISSAKGAHTLTYLTVPLGIVMICLWSLFPSHIPVRIHTN